MNLLNTQIVTNGAMAGNLTSLVVETRYFGAVGLQLLIASSTATGQVNVQVSANYNEDITNNVIAVGNWVNVDLTAANPQNLPYIQITSGQPANVYINLSAIAAPWMRITYTATSGTGTLNAWLTGKTL